MPRPVTTVPSQGLALRAVFGRTQSENLGLRLHAPSRDLNATPKFTLLPLTLAPLR